MPYELAYLSDQPLGKGQRGRGRLLKLAETYGWNSKSGREIIEGEHFALDEPQPKSNFMNSGRAGHGKYLTNFGNCS
jgi:hypothetical protein